MRLARVWKPCVLPSVTTTEFPSLLSPLEYVGGSDASLSIQARIFDAISIFEPLLALLLHATLTGRKLIAWATVERVLVIFQRSPRPEIVPESSNIGTAATGRECFSTTKRWKSATSCASSSFLSKFYILFLFLLVPRIDRFLDLFQKLDESGARWIEYETCERVSEWVSEMWWKMFGGKVISTFFDSCFVWILPSFKLYRIFCATIINHISIRFHSLEILFREYTLYIHFRRISVFLLVSRWTGHAVPVVKSSWREKEETRSERGYMGREIASGRPSAAVVSSFFDSLNGKLKRFG